MKNTASRSLLAATVALVAAAVPAADDGSQLRSPFRLEYVGYLRNGPKIAVYLAPEPGEKTWTLLDASGAEAAAGATRDFVANDFASGDSFFRIDFSSFTGPGRGLRLRVEGKESEPFDVDEHNPYGRLAEESFDYFRDHRAPETVFDKFPPTASCASP